MSRHVTPRSSPRWDHDDNYEGDDERHARLQLERREREAFEEEEQARRLKAKQAAQDAVRRRLHSAQLVYCRPKEQYMTRQQAKPSDEVTEGAGTGHWALRPDEEEAGPVPIDEVPWVPTEREADMMEVMAMKEKSLAASARLARQCETTWKPLPPSEKTDGPSEHNWFSEKVRRYVAINKRQEVRCAKCDVRYPEGDRAVICPFCKTKRFLDAEPEPEPEPPLVDAEPDAEPAPYKLARAPKSKPTEKPLSIAVTGPAGGGKTALVTTFCSGKFSANRNKPNGQRWNFTPAGGVQKAEDTNKYWTERLIGDTLHVLPC